MLEEMFQCSGCRRFLTNDVCLVTTSDEEQPRASVEEAAQRERWLEQVLRCLDPVCKKEPAFLFFRSLDILGDVVQRQRCGDVDDTCASVNESMEVLHCVGRCRPGEGGRGWDQPI